MRNNILHVKIPTEYNDKITEQLIQKGNQLLFVFSGQDQFSDASVVVHKCYDKSNLPAGFPVESRKSNAKSGSH